MNWPAADQTADTALFWVSRDGRLLDADAGACHSLGYSREELRAMAVWDIDPEFPPDRWPDHWRTLHENRTLRFQTTECRRDGSRFPVEVAAHYVELDGQEHVCALVQPLTAQKRTEDALRQSQERLALALAVSGQGLYDLNLVTRTAVFNDEYARMLGYEPSELELTPATWASWLHPEDRERVLRLYEDYITGKQPDYQAEFRLRTRSGAWIWVRSVGKVVQWDAAGQPLRMVGTHLNITERKRAEEDLERYRDHLEERVAERTAELRQAMTQLMQAEKLAALGNLVAGVAHELSTPLGNTRLVASALDEDLRAFAAAVESGALRRSQVDAFLNRGREAVDLLERNAARAADLIGHFKQVAVDQTSARRRRFSLRQTVEGLLVTLQPQFKRTAHRIEWAIPPDLELDSYPGPLEQVLTNLIANSLSHGFAGMDAGVIRIHITSYDAEQVQIVYHDNGTGIPEKILKQVFDPFFTTKLGSGGSGLGLYIVHNIVTKMLGGTIQAYSQKGQGATFILTLPRAAPHQPILEPPA